MSSWATTSTLSGLLSTLLPMRVERTVTESIRYGTGSRAIVTLISRAGRTSTSMAFGWKPMRAMVRRWRPAGRLSRAMPSASVSSCVASARTSASARGVPDALRTVTITSPARASF